MGYRQLTEATVVDYVASVPALAARFSSFGAIDVREVGDGNLNYVYIVTNRTAPDETVVVKQAVPFLRIAGESWPLGRQRMVFETAALRRHAELVPGMVPELFHADPEMSLIAMQNLRAHRIVRGELIAGRRLPRLADHLSTFLARTLFFTSDLHLDPAAKKAAVAASVNVELCRITEDFVFTHPYDDSASNAYPAGLRQAAIDTIQRDSELRAAVAEMKWLFMNAAEALLHGDLHTGSIMANERETYVIDPEFAFYGPMGFDVGAILANLWLAFLARGAREGDAAFRPWLTETAEAIWKGFRAKFLDLWRESDAGRDGASFVGRDLDAGASAEAFRQRFLRRLFADAIGFAGCKMMRRIVGIAKVADIAGIADPAARSRVEEQALAMGRRLVIERHRFAAIEEVSALARASASLERFPA
ncbi:MAG: S-methyl-5-thioribose kinase [Bauldia sp.]|nr:S-methyl-5-thioribose kinase [Bauldia sp.]